MSEYEHASRFSEVTLPLRGPSEGAPDPPKPKGCVAVLRQNGLIIATLVAVGVGIGLGLALRPHEPSDDLLLWLGLPGELFLRCLRATIVPLVVTMVITSTASLDPTKNGKLAVAGLVGFLVSHMAAVTMAICLFFVFKPASTPLSEDATFSTNLQTQDIFADLIRNIFPDNVVGATFRQASTKYSEENEETSVANFSAALNVSTVVATTIKKSVGSAEGTNILGLIVVCSAVGIGASKVLAPTSVFLKFFYEAQQVIFVVIQWLFWTTPIGVCSLIAKSIAEVDDIETVFERLGLLVGTVSLGLALHLLVVWSLVVFITTRKNPFLILARCVRPFILAFSATSTSVALPDMLTSCDHCDVSQPASSFIIPLSVTLQADGSALYIAGSALFLAHSSGGGVVTSDVVTVGAMTSILCLAIPPVPSSSIVTLVIVLTSINRPLHDVALLFAVEFILDRLRSGVNAVSHVLTTIVADHICSAGRRDRAGSLEPQDQEMYINTNTTDITTEFTLHVDDPLVHGTSRDRIHPSDPLSNRQSKNKLNYTNSEKLKRTESGKLASKTRL